MPPIKSFNEIDWAQIRRSPYIQRFHKINEHALIFNDFQKAKKITMFL